MSRWYGLEDIDDRKLEFAVLLAQYNDQYVVVRNRKRGGWEIPGGRREADEPILHTASRELYEETGAIRFDLVPFGVYQWNDGYGMVFYAEVLEMSPLPDFEIEEVRFLDVLPEGLNFGKLFYRFADEWNKRKSQFAKRYKIEMAEATTIREVSH